MTTATIIVAAGRGTRAGGPKPKQWQQINGRMVADWTIDLFLPYGPVVLVINQDDTDIADTLKARDQIMLATSTGQSIRVPVDGISFRSRSAGGVRVFNTRAGETVVSVAWIADQGDEEEDAEA